MISSNTRRLLAVGDVQKLTSLSRATIYRYLVEGRFPRPIRLSPRGRVAWRLSDVEAWIDQPLCWWETDGLTTSSER